jgi:hypothetical protein
LVAKSLKFILNEPLILNPLNKTILVLSFANKSTSIEVAANELYVTSYSICKSEKDGTSIVSGAII